MLQYLRPWSAFPLPVSLTHHRNFLRLRGAILRPLGKRGASASRQHSPKEVNLASSEESNVYFTVPVDEDGSRLDRVLVRHLGSSRRSLIMRLIRKGNVRLNKKRCKPEARVAGGDLIFLPSSLREAEQQPAAAVSSSLLGRVEGIPVLFEDDWLLVVDKPAGMVVHGGSGHGAGLIEALKEQRNLPELRLAHRLDRDTSGVLLLAKNLIALRKLSESFRERDMQKTYFAMVAGHPFPYAGRMQSKLAKGAVIGGERMVVDDEEGKEAITDYQVVMEFNHAGFEYALLALKPHSGRTHQLRVQLQGEGHAILGDNKYADKVELAAFRSIGGKGLMLHAWRLCFTHPHLQRAMQLRAPLPQLWLDFPAAE